MADTRKFLDLPGLVSYDTALKQWVKQNTGEVSDWAEADPTSVQGNVSGTSIIRKDNPTPGTTWSITGATPSHIFTPSVDCYLIIQKDNVYNDEIKTYLFDFTYIDNPLTPTWITGE